MALYITQSRRPWIGSCYRRATHRAGTEARQGETLLDLMLSASNGSSAKDDRQ